MAIMRHLSHYGSARVRDHNNHYTDKFDGLVASELHSVII